MKKNMNAIPETMQAMVLETIGKPLQYRTVPVPRPAVDQVLVRIIACGVCRTDLHIVDHELTSPKLPLIPGHEIVGMVVRTGNPASKLSVGDLVGIPWLGYTCGKCKYCLRGQENLCDHARFTGYTIDGGYAEYTAAYEKYVFPITEQYAQASGAPLMCAGLIGFRSYSMLPAHAQNIGIYGFGGAAHILMQVAKYQHKNIYAFTRDGDVSAQEFALRLGATWAGGSGDKPPLRLDGAILFAPVGSLVPKALADIDKGGMVVCGGIHMSDIPSFPYSILWEERTVKSVANLTREDGIRFLSLAEKAHIHTQIKTYALHDANQALDDLRTGRFNGAAVLVM